MSIIKRIASFGRKQNKGKLPNLPDFYLHVPSSYTIFGMGQIMFLTEIMDAVGIVHYSYRPLRNNILAVTINEQFTVPLVISLAKEYIFLMSTLIMQCYNNNINLANLGLATITLEMQNDRVNKVSIYFYKTLDVLKTVDVVNRLIEKRITVPPEEEDE